MSGGHAGGGGGPPGAFVYAPALAAAELRADHPLKPARARDCYQPLRGAGVFETGRLELVAPRPASEADVLRVHAPAYVDAVRRLSDTAAGTMSEGEAARYGFSRRGDNPPFAGMYDYYLLVCGAA